MPGQGQGYKRTVQRVYVNDPRDWDYAYGTDYTLVAGTNTALITGGTAGQVLSEYGWTTTALSYVVGSGADFASKADLGVPNHFSFGASGDLLKSPVIFGDDAHMRAVEDILGYYPTQLVMRVYAAFSVASADEDVSGFGLIEDGGAITTAADHMATFVSNATNFELRSGAGEDAGTVVDNAWHRWEAVATFGGSFEWFIDDASQGTLAITADEWPCAFSAHSLTTNRILLNSVHIFYR